MALRDYENDHHLEQSSHEPNMPYYNEGRALVIHVLNYKIYIWCVDKKATRLQNFADNKK